MSKLSAKQTAEAVTDYLNSFSNKNEEFIDAMNLEHRTLQQSFTRLCLAWLENCSGDNYRFDGRNEASHKISKEVIEGFRDAKGTMSNPSDWLPSI